MAASVYSLGVQAAYNSLQYRYQQMQLVGAGFLPLFLGVPAFLPVVTTAGSDMYTSNQLPVHANQSLCCEWMHFMAVQNG